MAIPGIGKLVANNATRAKARIAERLIFADSRYATGARVDHAVELARREDAGANLHETARRLIGIRGVRSGWRKELLNAVERHRRPTLIVWGSRDRVLPERHLRLGKARLPHARTHRFQGAGHMPQIECSAEFADVFTAFVADAASSSSAATFAATREERTSPGGGSPVRSSSL
jgi:pimeloyl-ACP methyl ester carboxylesterase